MQLTNLERRCIELSYRNGLTHVSSVLNTVNLISELYAHRKSDDPFVCGNGHAGLALYVVLESLGKCDAQDMLDRHGIHPCRDMEHGVWVSSGSLGQAETVACGLAMAYPDRTTCVVTSDGACAEGSVHESMRVAERLCLNMEVHVVFNGLGAYGETRVKDMPRNAMLHYVDQDRYPEFLRGLGGHYVKLDQAMYEELMG